MPALASLCVAAAAALLLACSAPEPPNVLLISLDTLRADRLSSYGAARPTPALDLLAQRGARFANAFSTAPWTLPAHASMLSGRYPTSIHPNPISRRLFQKTRLLSEMLAEHGYATGAITGGSYLGERYGIDRHFESFTRLRGQKAVAEAEGWLRRHADQRFFLFFHTYEVHAPLTHLRYAKDLDPGRLGKLYNGGELNAPHLEICCRGFTPTAAEKAYVSALYDGGVAAADRFVQRLWQTLGELGLQEKTLVIVTSDHGDELWEHTGRAVRHGHALYDEVLRVPLLWVDPEDSQPGRVVEEPVSLVDIVPSVLARLGIAAADPIDGAAFTPLLGAGGRWDGERVIFAEANTTGPLRASVRSAEGKLIVTPDPRSATGKRAKRGFVPVRAPVELYAPDDILEEHNLAERAPALRDRLLRLLEPRLQPARSEEPEIELDPATRRELEALGYLE